MKKSITVESDDPAAKSVKLSIAGPVDLFATVTPRVVRFNGNAGESMKTTVTIVPEAKYPFDIKKVRAHRGEFIKYDLEKSVSDDGKGHFTLTVENTKNEAGAYYDVIIMETDSEIQPEMKLNVMARLMDPKSPASGVKKMKNGEPKGAGDDAVENGIKSGEEKKMGENAKKSNDFLEVIQQLQKQKKENGSSPSPSLQQDPERAAELKKKFEALIREAQQRKALKEE